jgi:hypothetical protein
MLLSPASCHDQLQSLLSRFPGPHTALLATPNGQLVCCASKERVDEPEGEFTNEPWLDEPERIRLLLGLLSQWVSDESPRIECEVIVMLHTMMLAHLPAWTAIRTLSALTPSGEHVVECQHAPGPGTASPFLGVARQRSHEYALERFRGKSESLPSND